MRHRLIALLFALALPTMQACAQPLKLLTAGAFKEVVRAIVPAFESRSGASVEVVSDTAGNLARRIESGESFDVAVLTREGVQRLVARGALLVDATRDVARVGIGVGVRAGEPAPPLSSVDDLVAALRAARAVAYVDPAAGGSSGIYLDGLFRRLGIADVVRGKAVLVPGGLAAERVASGEADLVLQQASEILPVAGVVLAGLLPDAVQNITTYAGAVSARSAAPDAARALLDALGGAPAADALRAKGMMPATD